MYDQLINHVAQESRGTTAMMGGVQVIFTGDFFQLPPVLRAGDNPRKMPHSGSQLSSLTQANLTQNYPPAAASKGRNNTSTELRFCFQSDIWGDLFTRRNSFVLTEVHRQKDETFSKLLNDIRWGDCSGNIIQPCMKTTIIVGYFSVCQKDSLLLLMFVVCRCSVRCLPELRGEGAGQQ
jgi:hypothetical protein